MRSFINADSARINAAFTIRRCWMPHFISTTMSSHHSRPNSTSSFKLTQSRKLQLLVDSLRLSEEISRIYDSLSLSLSRCFYCCYYANTDQERTCSNYHQLTEELHRHGINCRHTGRVREHCTTPEARAILLTEMVVRSQKNHLNLKQRTAMATNVNSYNQPTTSAILAFLSLVLGGTKEPVCTSSAIPCGISREDTDQYWRVEVKEWIEEFFPFGLTPQERSPEYDLRLGIRPVLWFERLQATTGCTPGTL